MKRNDKKISVTTQKKIFKESKSSCSFCYEDKIELLEMHHITSRSSNGSNQLSNLILVCRNCHAKIENGIISEEEVFRTKRLLQQDIRIIPKPTKKNEVNVRGNISKSYIANTININSERKSKLHKKHPEGSIGASLEKRNYVKYLVKRYFDFRKADKNFGQSRSFNYGVLHKNIENKFKAQTYFINEDKFNEVVRYLQNRIDKTILAKRNKSLGRKNYSSFVEYLNKYG